MSKSLTDLSRFGFGLLGFIIWQVVNNTAHTKKHKARVSDTRSGQPSLPAHGADRAAPHTGPHGRLLLLRRVFRAPFGGREQGSGNREAEPQAAQQLDLLFALKALRESTMSTPAPPRRWNGPGHTAGRQPSQTVTEPGSWKAAARIQRSQPLVRDARRGAAARRCGGALLSVLFITRQRTHGSVRRSGAARGAGLGAAGPASRTERATATSGGRNRRENI